jgi:hypothetical protein
LLVVVVVDLIMEQGVVLVVIELTVLMGELFNLLVLLQ